MWLDFVECLLQVVDDIVDMLGADAQTNGGRCDVLLGQFLGRELRVCGGVGVYHQTLHVGHVSQQREDLQGVDKAPSLFLSALHFEGEDGATTLGEVLLVECVVVMVFQRRMMYGRAFST